MRHVRWALSFGRADPGVSRIGWTDHRSQRGEWRADRAAACGTAFAGRAVRHLRRRRRVCRSFDGGFRIAGKRIDPLSLNVIQPVGGTLVREYPLLTTRFAVAGLGLVALVIALRPGTIHDLIMTAASFGSVGLVVVTLFGLSTRIGGAASAAVALLLGGSGVVWRIVLRGYRYTLHLRRSLGSSRLSLGGHKWSANYCFLTFIRDFDRPGGGSVSGKADR